MLFSVLFEIAHLIQLLYCIVLHRPMWYSPILVGCVVIIIRFRKEDIDPCSSTGLYVQRQSLGSKAAARTGIV